MMQEEPTEVQGMTEAVLKYYAVAVANPPLIAAMIGEGTFLVKAKQNLGV